MPVRDSGEVVDQVEAIKAWGQAAHDILLETAGARTTIQYQALARQVQQRSGISTNQPTGKWVGPLLGVIARQCHARNLPLLTALCVRRDGSVGPAYDEILRFANIPTTVGEDVEAAALEQREACYRRWRGITPAPSAAASATRVVGRAGKVAAAKPASSRAVKKEPLQGNVCPTCFMQMSLTGVCDNCE